MGRRNAVPVAQQTQEWLQARVGKITASRFKDATSRLSRSSKFSKAAWGYLYEILGELLSGRPGPRFATDAMRRGTELEPRARSIYLMRHNTTCNARLTGLEMHPDRPMFGASCDMLVDHDGVWECKCPQWRNHLETWATGRMPEEHIPQVQGQLWVTGRQWCDFMSFNPDFKLQSAAEVVVRVERDDDYISGVLVPRLEEFEEKLTGIAIGKLGEERTEMLLASGDVRSALLELGQGYDASTEWSAA